MITVYKAEFDDGRETDHALDLGDGALPEVVEDWLIDGAAHLSSVVVSESDAGKALYNLFGGR